MRPLQSWGCRERRARKRINKSLRSHISAVKKCCQKNKNLRSSNTKPRRNTRNPCLGNDFLKELLPGAFTVVERIDPAFHRLERLLNLNPVSLLTIPHSSLQL